MAVRCAAQKAAWQTELNSSSVAACIVRGLSASSSGAASAPFLIVAVELGIVCPVPEVNRGPLMFSGLANSRSTVVRHLVIGNDLQPPRSAYQRSCRDCASAPDAPTLYPLRLLNWSQWPSATPPKLTDFLDGDPPAAVTATTHSPAFYSLRHHDSRNHAARDSIGEQSVYDTTGFDCDVWLVFGPVVLSAACS